MLRSGVTKDHGRSHGNERSGIWRIGLEVMGRNLALNVERNGLPHSVYNRTYAKTQHFIDVLAKGKKAKGFEQPKISSLASNSRGGS